MTPKISHAAILSFVLSLALSPGALAADESPDAPATRPLRAGASAVDISPTTLPAIQNGGFLERTADRVAQPLHARALVLSDGEERVAIAIVDSCMVPRDLCDDVKARVTAEIGIPRERVLISATHTHTAPSAMDYCLGSRADPAYTKQLPPLIARAIVEAARREEPAELGFTVVDAPDHTACRRWIRRLDRPDVDPFGERTIRAMMHPGYRNPDYVGPSGPEDPALSILAVRRVDGRPIALLGNYSMHYFGFGGGFSPDFFGLFARQVEARLAPGDDGFVGILSQGTSGDLWRGDYSRPAVSIGMEQYTTELVDLALEALRHVRYSRDVPLAMAERRVTFARRTPDENRLAWARKVLPDRTRRPRNRPEVYAEQAFFLHENPTEEVVLQAARIGDLGVTAIPCEVYALTGLELKARSPLQPTVNLSLANGAAGYIPPPEQHALGGYNTWPARTAGLEVEAEPRIVEIVLELLEKASGESRRDPPLVHGAYAATVLADKPLAYWRLEEFRGATVADSSGHGRTAKIEPRVAFYLPGPESAAFSMDHPNRCVHLAGGHVEASDLALGAEYSVELWFSNGVISDDRAERGTLFRFGSDELRLVSATDDARADATTLAIGEWRGETPIGSGWNHVVVARAGDHLSVSLNGRVEIDGVLARTGEDASMTFGGGSPTAPPLEGRIDEVSVFDRALTPSDVARHFAASGITAPPPPPGECGFEARPETPADVERQVAAIREARPVAYWPIVEPWGVRDASGNERHAELESGAATRQPASTSANFTGGRLKARLDDLGDRYSVALWFLNELPNTSRPVTGYFFSRGRDLADGAPGEHLGIGGTHSHGGRLIVFNGNQKNRVLGGEQVIGPRTWNHVVLVRDGGRVTGFLNGRAEPEISGELEPTYPRQGATEILAGGRNDNFANLRGRLDHVAVFDRPLTTEEVGDIFRASGLDPGDAPTPQERARPDTPPRSPEETLRATRVRRGFRLELVAAEPLIRDPVAIDWDAAGRLWVAEMVDYPSGMHGGDEPGGSIRVLEDDDRDGRFDRSTLFAEGLSFPNGVFVWRRGVIVTAAPEILYLEDADGDGRADRREVLYSGFLPGNQQLRVNGLRWGLDNWIYCASGGHHAGHGADRRVRSVKTGEEIALGSRDLRIRPAEGLLQPQSGPSQFGRVRDDWDHWFGVQNSFPVWHYVLADHYSSRNPHVPAPDARHQLRGANPTLWPAKTPQKRYHSFEHATRFTSACGPGVYRDDLLFERGPETRVFTCDPFHGIVQHAVLTSAGVTFDATVDTREGEHDFFASADRWCRPVMARTGPDGALWIVDMYRYMIEHPDWLPPAGREELRPFYRSGDDRGRIYRVVPVGERARAIPVLAGDTPDALLERLGSSNGIVRDLAHRMLVEEGDSSRVPALESMALGDRRPLARLHALCVLDGMRALAPRVVLGALADGDSRIVRHAIRLAEPLESSTEVVDATVAHARHADADVRLQLAHSLGEWSDPRAGAALGELAARDHANRWMRAAILSSALAHQEAIARRVAESEGSLRDLASPLLALALETDRFAVVAVLLAPLVAEQAELEAWRLEALARFMEVLSAKRMSLEKLARKDTELESLTGRARSVLERASSVADDDENPEGVRRAAVSLLGREAATRSRDRDILADLLTTTVPGPVQIAAVRRLRQLGGDPAALLAPWRSHVPGVRSAVFDALVSRAAWTRALLDAIEAGAVPVATIDAAQRQRLVSLGDKKLATRARSVLAVDPAEDRADRVAAFRPAIGLNGLVSRGRELFERSCSACHAIDGVGTEIGPDLRALTDSSGEALLTAIVDPNAAVDPRHVAYSAALTSGEVVHGLIVGETGNSILLHLADGSRRTILRSAIRQLTSTDRSFMPEGLEADLSLRDMADLLAFLQRR